MGENLLLHVPRGRLFIKLMFIRPGSCLHFHARIHRRRNYGESYLREEREKSVGRFMNLFERSRYSDFRKKVR